MHRSRPTLLGGFYLKFPLDLNVERYSKVNVHSLGRKIDQNTSF